MITVNSRKYDGSIRRSWKCELIGRDDSLLTLVGEFDSDVEHSDLGHIGKGTISYEYFWFDRWYNVFRFHEPSGNLRNYYCNICIPPIFADDVVDYVDLDIDILVWPDFSYFILDREEYRVNATAFGYPAELSANVEVALNELLEVIDARELPGVPADFATSMSNQRGSG
ncbi:MAG: DUF402 domain-containing protein [Blastocatellia bacterium]|nr:DUF402 domain-containing protein [Blastocatellia bacterium]